MLSSISPAAGRLLISEPFMLDPNFKRSVILIAEFSAGGAMGFVLNQVSDMLLGDIIPEISYSEFPLFKGGPVGSNTLHFVHRCPQKIDDGIEICSGIFWGGDFEQVKELVNTYQLNDTEIRFFVGYSGWSEGQLEGELKEDTWIVANLINPDILFNNNEESLWKSAVVGLGQRYAHIANFPENPALN
ncbi:putative transcriptional regulator [Mucilaginibacter gracilis]|uniref:Putative transcriptional regulator n=1 Tax=Mucilaginibacter gracilis TaxID=423350 RepID=A0A495J6S4_9SPHI|nr:YqgE/AlgH family protein [Mucilaginibacter gracilis]RKR84443.1 putative transcriptional regulator [Mucilaginibacter gracilis]